MSVRATNRERNLLPEESLRRIFRCSLYTAALVGLTLAVITVSAQAQSFSVMYTFTGTPDGAGPIMSNLLNANGTLYGTTTSGGAFGFGTIFKLSGGTETVLYSFTGGADGANPDSGLVRDAKGNLYGTTQFGGDLSCAFLGSSGCGVVYKLTNTSQLTVLHSFTGTDGVEPQGVILDKAGNLYGTTFFGGSQNWGVLYKIDTSGSETVVYSFTGGVDGGEPNESLTMDSAGNVYGATVFGGDLSGCSGAGCGVIFEGPTSGGETVLHAFTGASDGALPNGGLLLDAKGNVYGTATFGGDAKCNSSQYFSGCGVVFEVMPSTLTEKVMHTFTGPDGANPFSGLLRDAAGNFFSTTVFGGASNFGTVFEQNAKGETVLHSFNGTTDGKFPYSGLIRDAQGNLYSNTDQGGDLSCGASGGCGTIFKLLSPPTIVKFSPSSGAVGAAVTITGVSLSQATAVAFNGTAATFTVVSDNQVTTTVPAGATSGTISLTSPAGTAVSSTSFSVTP